MQRDIIHFSIPAFPIALARVVDSSLRGRPIGMAPGHSERAILQCVSTEARLDGVCEGMPVYQAVRLCPALTLLMPDPGLVSAGTRELTALSRHYTPLWEPASDGRIFLDMTGCSRLYGPGRDMAMRLEREVEGSLRLKGSAGVAGNKLVSKIASNYLGKPGICDVLRGSEAQFISPMSVSVLPGIGKTRENILLQDLNIHMVGQVAALCVTQLRLLFGSRAGMLHQRASGIDPTPVRPPVSSPSITEESCLELEENDDACLLAKLRRLAEGCAFRLRQANNQTLLLTLTLNYADGVQSRRSCRFQEPQCTDSVLGKAAERLFESACARRTRVRSMRLDCERLTRTSRQLELLPDGEHPAHSTALEAAVDSIRTKYGPAAIRMGRLV